MDLIYENSPHIPSTIASSDNCSQDKGNSSRTTKWTKVLWILAVSLVIAVGGLCVLGTLYMSALKQLSEQETKSTIMVRELTANYCRVKEQLSFYEAFTAQSLNCDVSLTAFEGKLYFFSCDKLTWLSSRDYCLSKGADLVSITSKSEQMFLHSKIKEPHWIGLNDLDTEGHWVWVNNQTLNGTGEEFWLKRQNEVSEPDNWKVHDPTGEHCAIVKNDVSYLNSWSDISCNYKMTFICERKIKHSINCAN